MIQVTVGHTITNTIGYLDTLGNPMLTPPTPDSMPSWTDSPAPPEADSIVIAPDGSSAVVTALAPGADTLNLSVIVGGKIFTASVAIAISAAPQVLGSVVINSSVN